MRLHAGIAGSVNVLQPRERLVFAADADAANCFPAQGDIRRAARLQQNVVGFRRIDLAQHEQGALLDQRRLLSGQHLADDRQRAHRRLRHQPFHRRERQLFLLGGFLRERRAARNEEQRYQHRVEVTHDFFLKLQRNLLRVG